MILSIADVLGPADIEAVRTGLDNATFVDGTVTAGWLAKPVKANLQARPDREIERLREFVEARLRESALFVLATRPKAVIGPLFSRYQPGHAYGAHVDDALISDMRTDVSFTVFLSQPATYEGGELIIDTASGEEAFKLPAGCVVTYPATTLHRVAPVTGGERVAAAGWVRSYVRDPARRELLFDLETARRALFAREGKSREFDLLSKSAANLIRMWAED